MSKKSDVPALILALLVTLGLLGGGIWLLASRLGSRSPNHSGTPPAAPTVNRQTGGSGESPTTGAGSFTAVQNVPSGLFSYGGSTSWAPLRSSVDARIQAARPEIQLRYANPVGQAAGSGSGIDMLLNDQIAFAQSSRPITDAEYQRAQQQGTQLKQIPVALDGIAAAVNPTLDIAGVTVEQLTEMYTGGLSNWKDVGGPNLPIVPIIRPVKAGGTVDLVLRGQPLNSNVQAVVNTTQALRRLAETPGGVYFASAPEVVPQCTIQPLPIGFEASNFVSPYQGQYIPPSQCPNQRNQLNIDAFRDGSYPLTRNLFVIVKQDGSANQQAGEAYANLLLSDEGQQAISQAGFVRIR